MKLIVGLGNPGEKYERTRHNLGFAAVDRFLKDYEPVKDTAWNDEPRFKSSIATITWRRKHGPEEKVLLVKPKTYMNNSGMAVSLLASFYKIDTSDIWIVNDELDLPVGSMKIRFGGAGAGHKGVESIIASLNTDKFWRFRLGIGASHNHDELAKKKITDADQFVLGGFGHGEAGKIRELIKRAAHSMKTALEKDIESAQNQFNTK